VSPNGWNRVATDTGVRPYQIRCPETSRASGRSDWLPVNLLLFDRPEWRGQYLHQLLHQLRHDNTRPERVPFALLRSDRSNIDRCTALPNNHNIRSHRDSHNTGNRTRRRSYYGRKSDRDDGRNDVRRDDGRNDLRRDDERNDPRRDETRNYVPKNGSCHRLPCRVSQRPVPRTVTQPQGSLP
jgi:hypothetical protein